MRGAFSVGNVLAGFSDTTIVRQRRRSGHVSQPKIKGFQKRDGEPEGPSSLTYRAATPSRNRNEMLAENILFHPIQVGQVFNNDGLRLPTEFWHTTTSSTITTREIIKARRICCWGLHVTSVRSSDSCGMW